MTSAKPYDLAIAGGGLAGGLIALAIDKLRPELRVALFETEDHFGGNHIWSFFDSDIAPEHRWLVEPLISHHWNGYDVRFPKYQRSLSIGYNSIPSENLDRVLRERLPAESLRSGTTLEIGDGTRFASAIIDARGGGDMSALAFGWQKFVGQTLTLSQPHGLQRPVIMDATVDQIDGYRFVYCLPFGDQEIFVEDTYYADDGKLDVAACQQRIADYVRAQGWEIEKITRSETGKLPVLYGGDFDMFWAADDGVEARAGSRAALIHPVTSYSLPMAVQTAIMIAEMPEITQAILDRKMRMFAAAHWNAGKFYRRLCVMMFKAAKPEERYRTLEHTYSKNERLIERFYAGKTTKGDQVALLTGRPPVPVTKAISTLMKYR